MSLLRILAATAAFATTCALAQPDTALMVPVRAEIAGVLGLDAHRARQVDAILEAAQARLIVLRAQGVPADDAARLSMLSGLLSIRYETDTRLASVLTPEEFARLKESVYLPQWERALPSRGTRM